MKKVIYIICGVVGGIFSLIVISGIIRFVLIGNDVIEPGKNAPDVENTTYVLNQKNINIKDGKSESGDMSVFGEPVYGDLDTDGDIDAATFILNNDKNTFPGYYAVLVMNNNGIFTPTNLMYLNKNIKDSILRIDDGRAVFGYKTTDGLNEKSMTSFVQKNVWIHFDKTKNEIGEWVKDFEGESSDTQK